MIKLKIKLSEKTKKWLNFSLTIFLLLALLILGFYFYLQKQYENSFFPGVRITGVKVAGLKKDQAEKIFNSKIKAFYNQGQEFSYQNKKTNVLPVSLASDPDLSQELVEFELDEVIKKAYALGRGGSEVKNYLERLSLVVKPVNIKVSSKINEKEITTILKNNFKDFETQNKNPTLLFDADQPVFSEPKVGLAFDYEKAVDKLKQNLGNLDFSPIELDLKLKQPDFSVNDAQKEKDLIKKTLSLAPIKIKATSTQDRLLSWEINQATLQEWLELDWDQKQKQVIISLKPNKIEEFLQNKLYLLEQSSKDAKFKLQNERVVEFQASREGRSFNMQKTLQNFYKSVTQNLNNEFFLAIDTESPQNITAKTNHLGINKLIAVGSSDFSGSPANRRHNIKVGAETLNGILIPPENEFSIIENLGKITPAKGYLPELVIKGNETVPEYGGGLCQISTTAFRLAVNAGLPITERKSHAYRVSYYEPAGTDATIYYPKPDLRFVNNTPEHLLLQTRIEGNKLFFEFWGTDDGRQITTTTPEITNLRYPGETKYIETTDIEPGKVRCTESAHTGADASFERIIVNKDGEIKKETFESHYRPWQAVCLVGVEEKKENATSTEELSDNIQE